MAKTKTTYADPITGLDNEPGTLARDAIRAEFLATALTAPTPDYAGEWNRRFNERRAYDHADGSKRAAIREIAARYGINPETV